MLSAWTICLGTHREILAKDEQQLFPVTRFELGFLSKSGRVFLQIVFALACVSNKFQGNAYIKFQSASPCSAERKIRHKSRQTTSAAEVHYSKTTELKTASTIQPWLLVRRTNRTCQLSQVCGLSKVRRVDCIAFRMQTFEFKISKFKFRPCLKSTYQ